MALSITSSDGQQNVTSNPQTAPVAAPGAAAKSGSVQPGTADSLLKSQQGIGLGSTTLTTVQLDGNPAQVRTQTQSQAKSDTKPSHHVDAVWLIIPVIFVLVAAGMFWYISRSAKSTTN